MQSEAFSLCSLLSSKCCELILQMCAPACKQLKQACRCKLSAVALQRNSSLETNLSLNLNESLTAGNKKVSQTGTDNYFSRVTVGKL